MGRFQVRVSAWRDVDVREEELMTLTVAAKRLGLSTSAVGDLVYRGVLRQVVDRREHNPRKASRVFVADVEAELGRRRARRREGDSRLRGKVR